MRGLALAATVVLTSMTHVQRQTSIFGLVLETATFSDFARVLGPAEVHFFRYADGSGNFACYLGSDGTALILESSIDRDNGAYVSSFRLRSSLAHAGLPFDDLFPAKSRQLCATTQLLTKRTPIDAGLRLGMIRNQVVQLLGRPTRSGANELDYALVDRANRLRERLGKAAYPDTFVDVRFARNRVVSIDVWYSSAL